MVLPLLQLKEFDQYTTTHRSTSPCCRWAWPSRWASRPREVRAIGVAGLLHDIGKIRIPLEVLTKPGKLTDEERAHHEPASDRWRATIIMQSDEDLELAAVVAYEHHIMLNGGGYPSAALSHANARWPAGWCTSATSSTRCSTKRPYRDAWPLEKVAGLSGGARRQRIRSRSRWSLQPDDAGRRRTCPGPERGTHHYLAGSW